MDKNFWNNIGTDYNSEIFDVRKNDKKKIVETWIKKSSGRNKSIADMGCGIGKWIPILAPHYKTVHAMDFSESFIDQSRQAHGHLRNVSFITASLTRKYRSRQKYNAVLCVNAILNAEEEKRKHFFNNIKNSLVRGGHLFLVVPCLESALYSQFVIDKHKLNGGFVSGKSRAKVNKKDYSMLAHGVIEIDSTPTKHYLKEELIHTLDQLGFVVEAVEKIEYSWATETHHPPSWLKAPYPWDWAVKAKKVRN